MFQVYVLRGLKSLKRYVGVTSQPVDEKLREHNEGATKWTRHHRPFELVYSEEIADKTLTLKRERYLKTGRGRKFLDTITKSVFCATKT